MSSAATRVIVVLGYSDGGARHDPPRLRGAGRAGGRARDADDVVVLSGWARVPGTRSEAELMAAAWSGVAREVVVDPDARTTVGNARNALDDILRVGAGEVVVVTSRWHAARAGRLPAAAVALAVAGRTFPTEPLNLRRGARAPAVGASPRTGLALERLGPAPPPPG